MKKLLIGLLALSSLTTFAYEIECTNGEYGTPLRGDLLNDKYYSTVLKGNGSTSIAITENIVLNIQAQEYAPGEVDINLIAARINYGWNPYASARGINFLQLSLNSNSLPQEVYQSDMELLNGNMKKREAAFQKLIENKTSIKKEFEKQYGELASFSCRVKN